MFRVFGRNSELIFVWNWNGNCSVINWITFGCVCISNPLFCFIAATSNGGNLSCCHHFTILLQIYMKYGRVIHFCAFLFIYCSFLFLYHQGPRPCWHCKINNFVNHMFLWTCSHSQQKTALLYIVQPAPEKYVINLPYIYAQWNCGFTKNWLIAYFSGKRC